MNEPALDLAICMAIASSCREFAVPDNMLVFGEVGLSGEIRAVSQADKRVQEAKKLGFQSVLLPEVCRSAVKNIEGIQLIFVSQIREAVALFKRR